MLDPRLLHVLNEVARTGSYSAAGRALGCSQPAVSQQIRALERAVGSPVTVRVGRSMQLTQVGEILARHAATVIRGVDAAEQEVRGFVDSRSGRVRVAAFASSCATLLPEAMARLAKDRPSVDVELVAAEPEDSIAALRRAECDVAVCYRVRDNTLDAQPLAQLPLLADRLLVLAPRTHPMAGRARVNLADFAGSRWMVGSTGADQRLNGWAQAAGFTPSISHVVDDYVAMQALIARGHGVGIVPGLAWSAHQNRAVVAIGIDNLPDRDVFALFWPQMQTVPAVAAMLAALRAAAEHLVAPPWIMHRPVPGRRRARPGTRVSRAR